MSHFFSVILILITLDTSATNFILKNSTYFKNQSFLFYPNGLKSVLKETSTSYLAAKKCNRLSSNKEKPDNVTFVTSIANLRTLKATKIGTHVITNSYYENGSDGGSEYILTSLNGSEKIDNGGTIIVGNMGEVWTMIQGKGVYITQFGAKMNIKENNHSQIQKALDNCSTVIIPEGECYYSGTLFLRYRQTLMGVSKNSYLTCYFPDSSSENGFIIPGGVSIHDITLKLIANGYSGDFLQWNSEYILEEYANNKGGITHTRNLDTDFQNVFIYKTPDRSKLQKYQGTAIKWLHTGKGKAIYGALFENVNIAGEFGWAIQISVEQNYSDNDPNIKKPWFTGQTYKNILINKCKNGIRIGTANNSKSKEFSPIPPNYFVFDAIQQQVESSISERMFHITNGRNITVINCQAWDWKFAKQGFERAPFRVSNYSNTRTGTKQINFINSVKDGSSIVFDKNMPPLSYSSYIGTTSPAYGGQNNISTLAESGANGRFTYQDLLEMPVGIYGSKKDSLLAYKLNIDYQGNKSNQIMLEVLGSFQNRKYFKVYSATMTSKGKILPKKQSSIYYGSMSSTNWTNRKFHKLEVSNDFWRDANGDSPTDLHYTSTVNRSKNPRNGFYYFDTTLNKLLIWNQSHWVDSQGLISIGTEQEYKQISNKYNGFTFYNIENKTTQIFSTNSKHPKITWMELKTLNTNQMVYEGDIYIITDKNNMEIYVLGRSPDGSVWYRFTNNNGVESKAKIK